MLHFSQFIRDPIHGMIPMTACEWNLLQTAPFSRLRGVRQMGMAGVSYPGARHTRFEHVIGAMHTAWLLCSDLPIFDDHEKRLIRLAALSHDLGHWPYSHSLEDAARRYAHEPRFEYLQRFLDHEVRTWELIRHHAEIKEVLSHYPEYADISLDEFALLAIGQHPRLELNLLIHSEIDADRIDYVMRDNYYCGFEHGVDAAALKDLYVPDADYGLVINANRLYLATQLLAARFHLINNIQNDPLCRLGDLLLAETIYASLKGAKAEKLKRFEQTADEGQDSDLEQFLRIEAPDAWQRLQTFVSGKLPYHQLGNYDVADLSPIARFAIQSLQIETGSAAQRIERSLEQDLETPLLVDLVRIKPPTDPLRYSRRRRHQWHERLTDTPIVKGIVSASLTSLTLNIFTTDEIPTPSDKVWEKWLKTYRKLDPSMSISKADRQLEMNWNGDRLGMGLLYALEGIALKQLIAQIESSPSRLDMLFLTIYATIAIVEELMPEQRIYLDGRETIWNELKSPELLACFKGSLPPKYDTSEMSGVYLNDLAFLQLNGLLYAPSRLERARHLFVERPKFGTTGWGRRLFKVLEEAAGEETRTHRIVTILREKIVPAQEIYQEYFSLLKGEEMGDSSKRRDLRRKMPIPLTL